MPTKHGHELLEIENRFMKLCQDDPRCAARIFTMLSAVGARLCSGDDDRLEGASEAMIIYMTSHGVCNMYEMTAAMRTLRHDILLQSDKRPDPEIV